MKLRCDACGQVVNVSQIPATCPQCRAQWARAPSGPAPEQRPGEPQLPPLPKGQLPTAGNQGAFASCMLAGGVFAAGMLVCAVWGGMVGVVLGRDSSGWATWPVAIVVSVAMAVAAAYFEKRRRKP